LILDTTDSTYNFLFGCLSSKSWDLYNLVQKLKDLGPRDFWSAEPPPKPNNESEPLVEDSPPKDEALSFI